jgi:hypothetical protein
VTRSLAEPQISVRSLLTAKFEISNNTFGADVNFSYLTNSESGEIKFRDQDLSNASFYDTNLEQVRFLAVTWSHPPIQRLKTRQRSALKDEFASSHHRGLEDLYGRVADNYRQLVLNYEAKRDFETAEDFHIGEMEMRRRLAEARFPCTKLRFVAKYCNTHYWYWTFSRYGTSYWVAFAWLAFWIFIAFPPLLLCVGFHAVDVATGKSSIPISYQLRPDFDHVFQWLLDYCKAVSLSVANATLQKARLYEPSGALSSIALSIESVITTAQSALVLLAIRRRFKR